MYDENELEYLLANAPKSEKGLREDLMIEQDDGSRACLNWELRGKGYHLGEEQKYVELSDEELLKSACEELEKRKYLLF